MTLFQASHQKYCNSLLNSLPDTVYFHTAARVIYLKCKWLITPLFKTLSRLPIILKINSKIFVTAHKARNNLLFYRSPHSAPATLLFLLHFDHVQAPPASGPLPLLFLPARAHSPSVLAGLLPRKAIPSEKTAAISNETFLHSLSP